MFGLLRSWAAQLVSRTCGFDDVAAALDEGGPLVRAQPPGGQGRVALQNERASLLYRSSCDGRLERIEVRPRRCKGALVLYFADGACVGVHRTDVAPFAADLGNAWGHGWIWGIVHRALESATTGTAAAKQARASGA